MKLVFCVLASGVLWAQATAYSVDSQFTQSGATAGGVVGGKVRTVSSTFDGSTLIAIVLSDAAGHTSTTTLTPAAGSTWAYWSLVSPSSVGVYTLSSSRRGGSIDTDPGFQSVTLKPASALETLQGAYVAMGCGGFFHWNMSTFVPGANNGSAGWGPVNTSVDTFAPTVDAPTLAGNMDTSLQTVANAGCTYATLTTKASSSNATTGNPMVLTDNIFKTSGNSTLFSTAAGDATPYGEVDLGITATIGRVELFNRNDNSTPQPGRLRDLSITFYDDSHTQVAQVTGVNANNAGYRLYAGDGSYTAGPEQLTINVAPTGARYIRISRTPTSTATDDECALAMMEVTVFPPNPRVHRNRPSGSPAQGARKR